MNIKSRKQRNVAFSFVKIPKRIRENQIAYEFWLETLPLLIKDGSIKKQDMKIFEACALTWANYIKAEEDVIKFGATQVANSGYVQTSPYFTLSNKYLEMYIKLANSIGLNAAARSRIGMQEEDEKQDEELASMLG